MPTACGRPVPRSPIFSSAACWSVSTRHQQDCTHTPVDLLGVFGVVFSVALWRPWQTPTLTLTPTFTGYTVFRSLQRMKNCRCLDRLEQSRYIYSSRRFVSSSFRCSVTVDCGVDKLTILHKRSRGGQSHSRSTLRKNIRQKQFIISTACTCHIQLHSELQWRRNALSVFFCYKSTDRTPLPLM